MLVSMIKSKRILFELCGVSFPLLWSNYSFCASRSLQSLYSSSSFQKIDEFLSSCTLFLRTQAMNKELATTGYLISKKRMRGCHYRMILDRESRLAKDSLSPCPASTYRFIGTCTSTLGNILKGRFQIADG